MKKNPWMMLGAAVFVVAAFLFWRKFHSRGPVIVAVVDTGVNPSEPEMQGHLLTAGAWNYFDSNNDTRDEEGHGTEAAHRILSICPACRILPLKVTRHGAGVRVADLENAITRAVDQGAKVINLSFGVVAPATDALKKAAERAEAKGALLVAAAGTGAPNPFQSLELTQLVPQSLDHTLVVGVAPAADKPEPILNRGRQLAFSVIHGVDLPKRGSSYAAAEVSGWAGCRLSHGAPSPETLRADARALAKAHAAAGIDPNRVGAGAVTLDQLKQDSGMCEASE
ncbi:MAG TPA: S8 family serine peptidase [Bdellovibrionota bacterium]|nr:S8 family serine peptidase [Bdellovibrionota bacterium]